ncbi:MAG: phage terminase large subunit [Clostridia bacterium]|nr:phage terminase large subunit [Clostridia bacterium]
MNKRSLGRPTVRQMDFLRATQRYIAYGGARGGGKSWAVRCKAILLALEYSGCRILVLRRTLGELRENHIRPLCLCLEGIASFSESKRAFSFANGSQILCGYCAKEKDLQRYQGQEYDFIFIDEATQMEEYVFSALKGCLRGTNGYPKRIYLTCNPGGVGHSWVKRLFIDRKYEPGEDPDEYCFIKAKLSDNKILQEKDPSYLKALQSLPPDLKRAWLDGCWDLFKGQYFEEFSRELHVCSPFEIPPSYTRYMAFDYGLDMLACLWIADDGHGHYYVYRELHRSGLIVSTAAQLMREYSAGEQIKEIFMPPDMRSRQKDSGLSMAELFYREGIRGVCADNRRVPGWLALKELLAPVPDLSGTPSPRLRIFESCHTLISHLPALRRDDKTASDASVHPHEITHICDALRYFALSVREGAGQSKEALDPLMLARINAVKRASGGRRAIRF